MKIEHMHLEIDDFNVVNRLRKARTMMGTNLGSNEDDFRFGHYIYARGTITTMKG